MHKRNSKLYAFKYNIGKWTSISKMEAKEPEPRAINDCIYWGFNASGFYAHRLPARSVQAGPPKQ